MEDVHGGSVGGNIVNLGKIQIRKARRSPRHDLMLIIPQGLKPLIRLFFDIN